MYILVLLIIVLLLTLSMCLWHIDSCRSDIWVATLCAGVAFFTVLGLALIYISQQYDDAGSYRVSLALMAAALVCLIAQYCCIAEVKTRL